MIEKVLQEYYEERFSMMSGIGWKDLIEDVQELFDTYNKINSTDSFEEFHKRKGQLDILQWILTLESVSEQTYEELKNEEVV
tara:strand:- start:959 stop:1204 length:246 start_codon:yes stop_codon:yes gene_type:complete